MFTQAGVAQTGPLKMFVIDPALAAVLAEVMTDKLFQSVLGGSMLTEEGGLNKL